MRNISIFITVFILFSFLYSCKSRKVENKKPNIIFILTDDQRWDALGYAGNKIIQTPNMDQLAQSGLYFKNAFVTTPICAASRASIFTGLYERTHNYTFGKNKLIADPYIYDSYPYLLKKAGYQTGFVGKFGVRVNDGMLDTMFHSNIVTRYPYFKEVQGKQVHLVDIHGDHAIDFIKSNKQEPFCLSLSFWSPHADDGSEEQYFWPQRCDSLYINDQIPVPETADPAFFESLPEYLKTTMNRKRWHWRYDTPEKYQEMVKGYYRMISGVDDVIGKIQNTLEEEGIAENTVIILMGDNGYFMGERGYAGKWLMHEQSLRVPLMIYDPRQPITERSKTLEEMVLNVDVTPTILNLAGLAVPERYQGESLTAFYGETPQHWRTSIFCEHRWKNNALIPRTECFRDNDWKFIRYDDAPELMELYNYSNDINEVKNLAFEPEYRGKVEYYSHKCDSIIESLVSDRVENAK
ncbi:sulfatase family protein [Saccharicrinis sp. GN24d3]|uniref:sulfatase family protein n=1 Tax=Saccharicrinis sp. GN24d3 TaxID=3458416 RepID=UPI0040374F95